MRTKTKTAFAVFTKTDSGKDYLVKGNFGSDEAQANGWAEHHVSDMTGILYEDDLEMTNMTARPKYPNGLFVKKVNY